MKIKVAMIVTGFPSKENPSHGIFNKNAADLLSPKVNLVVIQLRVWKPGRKIFREMKNSRYEHFVLSAPYVPLFTKGLLCFPLKFYRRAGKKYLSNVFAKIDVFHSVGASFAGALGAMWSEDFDKKHVLQIIGSDVNSELPQFKGLSCFKSLNTNVNAVGCNSKALKNSYQKLMGELPEMEVIYRGIDVNKFSYSFDKFSDGFVNILFLGGIPDYKYINSARNLKGGYTLMKAWEIIENEANNNKCRLIFAGPDSDTDEVHKWQSGLKFKENVAIKGNLSPDEVLSEFDKAHIVVVPSLEEGMPNVALEAGSKGKCVIASDVGGVPELIEDNANGFLVPPSDENALAQKLKEVFIDRSRILTTGMNLRKTIENNFNSEKFASGYVDLYKKVL